MNVGTASTMAGVERWYGQCLLRAAAAFPQGLKPILVNSEADSGSPRLPDPSRAETLVHKYRSLMNDCHTHSIERCGKRKRCIVSI